jgi:hypothetical protein
MNPDDVSGQLYNQNPQTRLQAARTVLEDPVGFQGHSQLHAAEIVVRSSWAPGEVQPDLWTKATWIVMNDPESPERLRAALKVFHEPMISFDTQNLEHQQILCQAAEIVISDNDPGTDMQAMMLRSILVSSEMFTSNIQEHGYQQLRRKAAQVIVQNPAIVEVLPGAQGLQETAQRILNP